VRRRSLIGVHELVFEPDPYDAYTRIRDERVLDRLDAVLDQLERDPGAAAVRQHRFSDPPVWCVVLRIGSGDWAILWEPGPATKKNPTVVIHYVGTADLTV
jgi:hypothetical protein